MWRTSPLPNKFEENEIYALTFELDALLVDELERFQLQELLSDKELSEFINNAVMSTNRPLLARTMIEEWFFTETDKDVSMSTRKLIARLQSAIFTSVLTLCPDRMLAPHKYGYIILTMVEPRVTLLSFPRYRYSDIPDIIARQVKPDSMSVRGWKNVKLDRFIFVKSLPETMFSSRMR